jgi:hypothetical protein
MPEEKLVALVEDIQTNGMLEPIVPAEGSLLGHRGVADLLVSTV